MLGLSAAPGFVFSKFWLFVMFGSLIRDSLFGFEFRVIVDSARRLALGLV